MLLGNIRTNMNSHNRRHSNRVHSIPSLMNSTLSSQKTIRTSNTQKPTMINHSRTPYRYTTVTLLSLRSPSETFIFPDHLVERRFLDKENYIDLDRMLIEKGGKFDLESFNMRDGPIQPNRIHKYDFSDATVIEKVKNRRPKDPLTPQQVAALTSVTTCYQPSTSLDINQTQSSHVWIDDYSHQHIFTNSSRHHVSPQPLMPYQRLNPNQCELYTKCIKSLLPTYQSPTEKKSTETINTIPILQRLFEAQRLQKNEQEKIHSSQITDTSDQQSHPTSTPEVYEESLSEFCTPTTPKQPTFNKAFQWLLSTSQNQKDAFTHSINEHLKCSTTMETPSTPSSEISYSSSNTQCGIEDDDQQKFYSALPSPVEHQDNPTNSLKLDNSFFTTSNESHPLEYWFGTSIYKNTYPCMPSEHVLSAYDFEQ